MTVNFCNLALPAIPFKCHYWVEISVSWKWERPVIWPQRAIWSFKNMNKCTGPPVTDNAAWISTKAFPFVFEPALSKAEAYEQRSHERACNSGSIKVRITYVFPFWWGAMRVMWSITYFKLREKTIAELKVQEINFLRQRTRALLELWISSLVARPHPSRSGKGVWLHCDIPIDPVT